MQQQKTQKRFGWLFLLVLPKKFFALFQKVYQVKRCWKEWENVISFNSLWRENCSNKATEKFFLRKKRKGQALCFLIRSSVLLFVDFGICILNLCGRNTFIGFTKHWRIEIYGNSLCLSSNNTNYEAISVNKNKRFVIK